MGLASLVLQGDDEDLQGLLHQLLPVVREKEVVVGNAVAHWVIGAHHIDQRGKQRQGMPGSRQTNKHFSITKADVAPTF